MPELTFYVDMWPGWSKGHTAPIATTSPAGMPYANGKRYKFTVDIPDPGIEAEDLGAVVVQEHVIEGKKAE